MARRAVVASDGDQSAADGGFTISNLSSSTLVVAPDATAAVAADKEIRLGTQTSTGTGAAVLNVQGGLTNSGTLSILRGSTVNVSGDLEQSGPLVVEGVGGYGATLNVNGGGILTLGGTDPVTLRSGTNDAGRGRINVTGGTLVTGTGFTYDSPSTFTARLTLSAGGTLALSGPVAELADGIGLALGPGGGVFDTAGHDTTIAVPVDGEGALVKDGAGRLTLANHHHSPAIAHARASIPRSSAYAYKKPLDLPSRPVHSCRNDIQGQWPR